MSEPLIRLRGITKTYGQGATALQALSDLPEWTIESIEQALRTSLIDELGLKPKLAFGPVRLAITGRRISPPLFESMDLLGRERSLARLAAVAGATT